VHAELKYAEIEEIPDGRMHRCLARFVRQIYETGQGISRDFLMPAAA
jgi:hypothetical protein